MSIMDLKGSDFASGFKNAGVYFCGGGILKCIYQDKHTDVKLKDVLAAAKEENPDIQKWVIFEEGGRHFTVHPYSIKHAVVDNICVKQGELNDEILKELFRGISTVVFDDNTLCYLAKSYDPKYCK